MIVLVVNMIVGSLPSKYTEVDVSEQKLYSIGDDTKKFLKDLDKDVTIYQVVQLSLIHILLRLKISRIFWIPPEKKLEFTT